MERLRTQPWDAADYLQTEEDIAAYLEAVLEDGDPRLLDAVHLDIAKARGSAQATPHGTASSGGTVEDLWSSNFAALARAPRVRTRRHDMRLG